jgi:uncharacterized protein (DUF2126 family)
VRLTIGGEPTFIADSDFEAPNGTPRRGADQGLVCRPPDPQAARQVRAGSLLHHGQGKWYPGESLPRWGYSIYWRKDGVPIWRDESLIAGDRLPEDSTVVPRTPPFPAPDRHGAGRGARLCRAGL